MFGIGAGEFILIMIVGLIVFGPSKLPEIGRSLGKMISEFRKAQATLTATLTEPDPPSKPDTVQSKPAEVEEKSPNTVKTQTIEEVTEMINSKPVTLEKANLSKETAGQ